MEICNSVIKWKLCHIKGHQDEKMDVSDLDKWAWLSIEMDWCAKLEWDNRWVCLEDETPQAIPSEYWSIWYGDYKLSNLGRSTFDAIIKTNYSANYWIQAGKLGDHFNYIDWEACGDVYRLVSTIQWIKLTKWVTGWLPDAKICLSGISGEPMYVHVVEVVKKRWIIYFIMRILVCKQFEGQLNATLAQDLSSIGIIPQLVPMFVKMLDNEANIASSLNVEIFQAFPIQTLIGFKWTNLGMFSKEWHHLLT